MSALYARLLDAHAHLFAASIQRTPSDDTIIAAHIDAADRLLRDALREIEATPPVITHPRPSYHGRGASRLPDPPGMRAAHMLPCATLDALNGDDTPPDDEAA